MDWRISGGFSGWGILSPNRSGAMGSAASALGAAQPGDLQALGAELSEEQRASAAWLPALHGEPLP